MSDPSSPLTIFVPAGAVVVESGTVNPTINFVPTGASAPNGGGVVISAAVAPALAAATTAAAADALGLGNVVNGPSAGVTIPAAMVPVVGASDTAAAQVAMGLGDIVNGPSPGVTIAPAMVPVVGAPTLPAATAALEYQSGATGAVARSVAARLGDVVSAFDFGAKGDGATDDTAALQAFINYLGATGNAGRLAAGTYNVSASLTVSLPIRLSGPSEAVIHNTNAALAGAVLYVESAGANRTQLSGFQITSVGGTPSGSSGITIVGGEYWRISDILVSGTNLGIYVSASQAGAWLERCFVSNCASHGITVDAGNMDVDGCYAVNCGGNGFNFTTVSGASAGLVVRGCTSYQAGGYGFAFIGSASNTMIDLVVADCVNSTSPNGDGFFFDTYGKNIVISGLLSEEAGVNASLQYVSQSRGIHVSPNNRGLTITGCQATFSGASGILVDCSNFVLSNSSFIANVVGNFAEEAGILLGASGSIDHFSVMGCNTIPGPGDNNSQPFGINFFTAGNSAGTVVGCLLAGTNSAIGNPSHAPSGAVRFVGNPGAADQ